METFWKAKAAYETAILNNYAEITQNMERKKRRSKSKNEEMMSKELKVLYGFQPLFSLCPNVGRTQVP